jgi:hypothetical protein
MRDKKNIAFAEKDGREFGKPAGAALAAVIPEDGGKRAFAFGFVEEAVKNEIAAGEGHFNGIPLRMRKSRL